MARYGKYLRFAVPAFIFLGLAYGNYAICYIAGYTEVYIHFSKPAAYVLWILIGICQAALFYYWVVIFTRGPGYVPRIAPFDLYGQDPSLLPPPDAFLCDEHGFPFWCSQCQSIKPARALHLSGLNACVSRFDHNCVWIGMPIGRDNHLPFFQFVQFFDYYFIITLCYIAPTTRLAFRHSHATPHYIIMYVFCIFWILSVLSLLGMQLVYLRKNFTTIDDINIKQARTYTRWEERARRKKTSFLQGKTPRHETGIRYINIAHKETRVVVAYHIKEAPFNLGFKHNLVNVVLNGNVCKESEYSRALFWKAMFICFFPFACSFVQHSKNDIESGYEVDDFSPAFLRLISQRIEQGKFEYPLYLQHSKEPAVNGSSSSQT